MFPVRTQFVFRQNVFTFKCVGSVESVQCLGVWTVDCVGSLCGLSGGVLSLIVGVWIMLGVCRECVCILQKKRKIFCQFTS